MSYSISHKNFALRGELESVMHRQLVAAQYDQHFVAGFIIAEIRDGALNENCPRWKITSEMHVWKNGVPREIPRP